MNKLKRLRENIMWYLKEGYAHALWGDEIKYHEAAQEILWFWNVLGYIIYLLLRFFILPIIAWILFIAKVIEIFSR